jgi:group I intron endonuclease
VEPAASCIRDAAMGCIYMATNTVNGKRYIGLTIRTLQDRRWDHQESAARGSQCVFHRAIRKYGNAAFEWRTLLEDIDAEDLPRLEIMLIRKYETKSPHGYNLTAGGEGPLDPSEQTRVRMRDSHLGVRRSPEAVEKGALRQRGQKRVGQALANIRKSHEKNRGKKREGQALVNLRESFSKRRPKGPHSEQAKKNIRDALNKPEIRAKISAGVRAANQRKKNGNGKDNCGN